MRLQILRALLMIMIHRLYWRFMIRFILLEIFFLNYQVFCIVAMRVSRNFWQDNNLCRKSAMYFNIHWSPGLLLLFVVFQNFLRRLLLRWFQANLLNLHRLSINMKICSFFTGSLLNILSSLFLLTVIDYHWGLTMVFEIIIFWVKQIIFLKGLYLIWSIYLLMEVALLFQIWLKFITKSTKYTKQ